MYSLMNAVAILRIVLNLPQVLAKDLKMTKKRDYKAEYKQAKANKTKSYMHKFTEAGKKTKREANKARRKVGLKKGDPREVDHKKPISKGGTNARSNLAIKSRKANRAKGNK
tara:strand:+ start:133 stop:468 length:336 start_codon:yes stop_codon:yes gene_type:complete